MYIGPVGPVLVAAVPAAQDVDVLVVIRSREMRGTNHNLPVAVGVARFSRPFAHSWQYICARIRGTGLGDIVQEKVF